MRKIKQLNKQQNKQILDALDALDNTELVENLGALATQLNHLGIVQLTILLYRTERVTEAACLVSHAALKRDDYEEIALAIHKHLGKADAQILAERTGEFHTAMEHFERSRAQA